MSRNGLTAGLAAEVAASILGNGSGGEPSCTYDKDTRLVLARVFTYLLDLDAKKQSNENHLGPESAKEVQDD